MAFAGEPAKAWADAMYSHAREVAAHLEPRRRRVRAAAAAYVLLTATYLIWRATVFNPDALWFSWIFYLAEVYGGLLGLTLVYCAWRQRVRDIPPPARRYTVDVLVPVYTEPAAMIELTVIGAKGIAYPHQTWLLDDGRRPELKAIAAKHGVHYVTRLDNRGAKAGNLNHALQLCRGDVVAVFDADHIAQAEALDKLTPFLDDPAVGMVQAPQCYYNEDAFLYRDRYVGGGRWHEQAYFMDVIQSSHDVHDACTGIGTGVVYRRAALDAIGGFPEKTITEDIHTSLRMHKHGLKTVYLNEPVAWGVAAADVSEFNKTRRRWAHGNLHALLVENILFCRGLPWRKRLPYLMMGLHMQEGWQQLVFLLIPAWSMIFYVTPFEPSLFNTCLILGVPPLAILTLMVAGAGYLPFLPTQVFATGKMLVQLAATRGLLGKTLGWQVSLKNVLGRVSFGMLAPHFAILIVGLLGLLFTFLRVGGWLPFLSPPVGGEMILSLACFWVGFNLWRSWRWIRDTIGLTLKTHQEYQFEVRVPVVDECGRWLGITERLCTTEGRVDWMDPAAVPPGQVLHFILPGHAVRATALEAGADGRLVFECADAEELDWLRRALYSVDWHRQIRLAQWAHEAHRQGLGGVWKAACLRLGESITWAMLLPPATPGVSEARLLTSVPLRPGERVEVQTLEGSLVSRLSWRVVAEVVPDQPMPQGLNRQVFRFFSVDS